VQADSPRNLVDPTNFQAQGGAGGLSDTPPRCQVVPIPRMAVEPSQTSARHCNRVTQPDPLAVSGGGGMARRRVRTGGGSF